MKGQLAAPGSRSLQGNPGLIRHCISSPLSYAGSFSLELCARHEFDLAIRFGVSRSRSRKPAVLGGNLEEHHPAWWIVSDKSISMARQATEMKQRLREIHWHLLDREKLRIREKASNL